MNLTKNFNITIEETERTRTFTGHAQPFGADACGRHRDGCTIDDCRRDRFGGGGVYGLASQEGPEGTVLVRLWRLRKKLQTQGIVERVGRTASSLFCVFGRSCKNGPRCAGCAATMSVLRIYCWTVGPPEFILKNCVVSFEDSPKLQTGMCSVGKKRICVFPRRSLPRGVDGRSVSEVFARRASGDGSAPA